MSRVADHFDDAPRRDWQAAEGGTVRFALVGLGWWARERALPAIADSDLCEATTLVSGSADKAERVAADADVDHTLTYERFAAGEAADAYDAAYVATPNASHLEHGRAAATNGAAVLCEKPLEATVERGRELVEACEDAGVTLMTAYRMQTDPAVRRLRELLEEGFVGDRVAVHGHMSQRLLEMNPDPDQWRLDPDRSGYGTSVMDLGVYPLNTARFLLDADPVAVAARTHAGSEGFEDVPDERATFLVDFADGVHAACTASQNAHEADFLELVGTGGRMRLSGGFLDAEDRHVVLDRSGTTTEVRLPPVDQMREEVDYFADRLLTGRDPHPDGRHGLADLRAMRAIHEAAGTDRWVDL